MHKNIVICLIILSIAVVVGCAESDNHTYVSPRTQPLAHEVDAYKPDEVVESNGVITLREALSLTLMHNPRLRAFSWGIRAAQARELQVGLWPNPELEIEIEEAGGSGERSGFNAAETTIQLSQLIELGDKSAKRTAVASLEKELAGFDYQSEHLEVLAETTKAFIEVLAGQRELELAEELLGISQELVDTVGKRVEAGKDSPVERTKAAIGLSNTSIRHRQAVQNLKSARKYLASMWAGDEPKFSSATGKLESISPVPARESLAVLLEQNPAIVRWTREIDKSKADLALEKTMAVPDIAVSAGVQRFNESDENAVVFGISIPLGISDRNQGARLEAIHNLARTRQQGRAAAISVRNEFDRAYTQLTNSYIEATELQTHVLAGSQEVFEASMTGYREGKDDYLHVLDAQRTLFEAREAYIDALASYHFAKTDVERLVGCSTDSVCLSKSED